MMKRIISTLLLIVSLQMAAQDPDSLLIKEMFNEALTSREAYENLRYLCKECRGRIAGTPQAAAAVEFTRQVMLDMDLDSVYLQELMVPKWISGSKEKARITSLELGSVDLPITGLGRSVGTSDEGILSQVVEIQSFEELEVLGKQKIEGKIVFFNRPMDPTFINTFAAYGRAANQRTRGASRAAPYGALAVIVRSLTTALDDHPHSGVMYYEEGVEKIPAVAVSTNGADLLSSWLMKDPELQLLIISNCRNEEDAVSYNVIGEIRGSCLPDEIITVGGHLDAWHNTEGAHDDGAGCIQSIEVLRIYKALGIRPKRTVRAVMFMDEEIAQSGGRKYAELAETNTEKHYLALESDRGGLMPVGFGFGAKGDRLDNMIALQRYFTPYGLTYFRPGGGGVDIGPLKTYGIPLLSYIPEMQRYFDFHHSAFDTFEQVNFRELQMGSASIAALIYLMDRYDL